MSIDRTHNLSQLSPIFNANLNSDILNELGGETTPKNQDNSHIPTD